MQRTGGRVATLAAVVVVLALVYTSAAASWDIRQHLETKTPYWSQQNSSTYTPPPAVCYPVHIDLVARHGTRQPTKKDIVALVDLQASIAKHKNAITDPALQWIYSWRNPFEVEDAGYLVYRGEIEHYELAKRFLSYFPDVLNATYEPSRFPFRSTQISRTGISANSFGYGLFEGRGRVGPYKYSPFFVTAANISLDYELRFFDNCPLYTRSVLNNKTALQEDDLYSAIVMPGIAQRLTSRLNTTEWNLTESTAKAFWKACQFQASVDDVTDQFCSLFDEEDVEQLNYIADLSSYYEKGYGYKIDYSISCPLLRNFMDAIDGITTGPTDTHSERGNLRFAHAETIMPYVALLGFYKDSKPLKYNDPPEVIKTRQWRASMISPYAANVAFVLYNCTQEHDTNKAFKVKVMVNERELQLPGCDDLYCPVEKIKELYAEDLTCDFNHMCDVQDACEMPDDYDEWSIKQKGGAVVVVTASVGGLVLGMCLLGVVLLLVRRFSKKQPSSDYDLLEAGSAIHF